MYAAPPSRKGEGLRARTYRGEQLKGLIKHIVRFGHRVLYPLKATLQKQTNKQTE